MQEGRRQGGVPAALPPGLGQTTRAFAEEVQLYNCDDRRGLWRRRCHAVANTPGTSYFFVGEGCELVNR